MLCDMCTSGKGLCRIGALVAAGFLVVALQWARGATGLSPGQASAAPDHRGATPGLRLRGRPFHAEQALHELDDTERARGVCARGMVCDADDIPLSAAQVRTWGTYGEGGSVSVQTDSAGRWHLERLSPPVVRLVAVAPGKAPSFLTASAVRGSVLEQTFVLVDSWTLMGRALDEAGQPLSGTLFAWIEGAPDSCTLTETGHFHFTRLPLAQGAVSLWCGDSGMNSAAAVALDGLSDSGDRVLDVGSVVFSVMYDLEVRVEDAGGRPGAGVRVAIKYGIAEQVASTGRDGRVVFPVPEGEYHVYLPDFCCERVEPLEVARLATPVAVTLTLPPSILMVGSIVFEDGRDDAFERLAIAVHGPSSSLELFPDSKGGFAVTLPSAWSSVRLEVGPPSYPGPFFQPNGSRIRWVIAEAEVLSRVGPVVLNVGLGETASVEVRVIDKNTGAEVEEYAGEIAHSGEDIYWGTRYFEHGVSRWALVRPGSGRVRVRARDGGSGDSGGIELRPGAVIVVPVETVR